MNRLTATFIAVALAGTISSPAQSAQSKDAQASAAAERAEALPKGTRLMGKLTTKLDTKRTKVGQPVVIEVSKDVKSGDQTLLKKGSLIKGTVTQVQAFSKDNPAPRLRLPWTPRFRRAVNKSPTISRSSPCLPRWKSNRQTSTTIKRISRLQLLFLAASTHREKWT